MAVGQQIEAIQRRAARVITGGTYDVRSKEILQNLNWTPIEQSIFNKSRNNDDIKALPGRLLNYLAELFTKCENNSYSL
jgi:hypothetical protein